MTLIDQLHELVNKFNSKVKRDEKLAQALEGIKKAINLDFGEEFYSFRIEDGCAHSLRECLLEDPDVTIAADLETIKGLLEKRIRPMKAFAQRKLRVAGEIEDLLRLRKLF